MLNQAFFTTKAKKGILNTYCIFLHLLIQIPYIIPHYYMFITSVLHIKAPAMPYSTIPKIQFQPAACFFF